MEKRGNTMSQKQNDNKKENINENELIRLEMVKQEEGNEMIIRKEEEEDAIDKCKSTKEHAEAGGGVDLVLEKQDILLKGEGKYGGEKQTNGG